MSKVIRTVRISGPVVTLGQAESTLYLRKGQDEVPSGADLEAMMKQRSAADQEALAAMWQERLEQERQQSEAAAQNSMQAAAARWEEERQRLHAERFEAGRLAGHAEKEEEVRQAVARLDQLHQALGQERGTILRAADQLVVDVALALGRKITGMQATADPKVLARVMRAALDSLAEHSQIVVKVHPEDLETARRFAARWVERVAQDAVLRVRPSHHVERGGCLVETPEEQIDARLEEQFRILHEALRQAARDSRDRAAAVDKVEADEKEGQGDG